MVKAKLYFTCFSSVSIVDFEQDLLAENTTNLSATQNEHYQKINANYKNNNPRKQNKFKRNPKYIKKTF